ncbi:MAG: hypothetical protein JW776_11500 [Candidatus Lokiarchaeota archaeon]|nr:hypothetical protein [Candidatus Lokiarchaeota archaeon]
MASKDVQEFLDRFEMNINSAAIEYKLTLKGFDKIFEFISRENEYWEQHINTSGSIDIVISHFRTIFSKLKQINNAIEENNIQSISNIWNNIKGSIKNDRLSNSFLVLYSKSPYTHFLIDLYSINKQEAEAAYQYISNVKLNQAFQSKQMFSGFIKGYEFENSNSGIVKRRNSEKKALSRLRKESETKVHELESVYKNTIEQHEKWNENTTKDYEDWKSKSLLEQKELLEREAKEFLNLKTSYSEKLKLEGPVQYWTSRVNKYKKQSIIWLSVLSGTVVIFMTLFIAILYNVPESFNYKLFSGDPRAIKSLIVFALIVSFSAYLIRTLSRLVFSSFHLQRDSEEREQLTLIYLALMKKGEVKEDDRKLILESLFSRADTGLLKGDSAPEMPGIGGLINRLIK